MRLFGKTVHIMQATGAIIDLRDQRHSDFFRDMIVQIFGGDKAQLMALIKRLDQPLRDIKIGWEISAIRQDHFAIRAQLQRRVERLKDFDR